MARTVLATPNRYHNRGKFKMLYIPRTKVGRTPTVTLPQGPLTLTLALLDDTGTVDLTPGMVPPLGGFTKEQADDPAPSYDSLETGTVPGEITYPAASVVFYKSEDDIDVRQTLVEGSEGYFVIAANGLATGRLVNIFEVTVKAESHGYDGLATVTIPVSVSKAQFNIAIPAS
jgi:hypothetical protein